jgi:probable O-glycosylation ligase (exosortase A-associated)
MRDLAFTLTLFALLPLALARPFVGVLLLSWISFMNPHQTLWGFATSMPWVVLTFGVTIIGCVVAREPRRLPLNAVTVFLVVLIISMTITSFSALADPSRVWTKWEFILKIIVTLLLTAALLTDRWRIHALVWVMVISVGYFGVRGGLFTLVTGGGFIVTGPPNSIISDRNHLAAALLIALPLMNYLRLQSRHRIVRIGLAVAMVLSLFSVVGSQSRGALVGLAATALFLWLRAPRKIVSGMAIAVCVAVALAFMPDSWWARMDTIENFEADASAMGRVQIWHASLLLALDRPLVGGGFYSMYTQAVVNTVAPMIEARAAHSIWMEVLGEHGFPTFFVWLLIILSGVVYSMRITRLAKGREDLRWAVDLARMAQVSMVAYVVAGSLLSLAYWDFFWALMLVLGATHTLVRREAWAEKPRAAAFAKRRQAAPEPGRAIAFTPNPQARK